MSNIHYKCFYCIDPYIYIIMERKNETCQLNHLLEVLVIILTALIIMNKLIPISSDILELNTGETGRLRWSIIYTKKK